MPGGPAQATMHDFVRQPLAETQAHGGQGARSVRCDDAAELYVDGMRLRRDRVGQWVFPRSNDYPTRQYQLDIAKEAVLRNTLVSLPTGTGKTLIAAVVMYNFHRWFERGKIVFLAPTRPLVSQQIHACAKVTWISAEHMAELTGTVAGPERQRLWASRRVFFCTPQVFENDLDAGWCPARDVVCLVLDEAHKAQGDYAYVNVVRKIAEQTARFRVLALTATPGSDRAKIQRVISNLRIAHVEVRHEDDPCLQRYMHVREMETMLVRPNTEIEKLQTLAYAVAASLMQPLRAYLPRGLPVEKISADVTLLDDARDKWLRKRRTLDPNAFNTLENAYQRLRSCLIATDLLIHEGFESFFKELRSFAQKEQGVDDGKYLYSPRFSQLWSAVTALNARSEPLLHPKQQALCGILLDHFTNHGADTKAIVFAQYRRVVAGIESTLNRQKPLIKARCFVGQAASKGSAGMNQLEQRQLVERFKNGDRDCNVLVATSIGEEGLDIGEVDLIVQYDCLSSHIRTVQRIGRTGRKRNGRAIQLVSTGKEQEALGKQKKAATMIKKVLGRSSKWAFHSGGSFRMIPAPLPNPTLSKVDLAPPDRSCTKSGGTNGDSSGHTTQANMPELRPSKDRAADSNKLSGATQTVRNSLIPRKTELVSSATSSTSTGLTQKERAEFLRKFACTSPPGDLSLDSVASQYPDACAVLTKAYRCAHTALTKMLFSVAQGTQQHKGTDQFETATSLSSTCCTLSQGAQATARLSTMYTGCHRASSSRDRSTIELTEDPYPDHISELLRNPPAAACRTVFCPQDIRYLLPDCIETLELSTPSNIRHDRSAARPRFSAPSYIRGLNDQFVLPPPAVPQDINAFVCGAQKQNLCSPNVLRQVNCTSSSDGLHLSDIAGDSQDACSNSQPTLHSAVEACADGSRRDGTLGRTCTLAGGDTGPTIDLVARSEPGSAIPNELHGPRDSQTCMSVASAPTVKRGLTEEQRRRIAENRKKAQARRAAVQAQKTAQEESSVASVCDGAVQCAESYALPQHTIQESTHESAPRTSIHLSQQHGLSQKSTPANQDSEIELGFSSPSPVATKRLRKRRQGHPERAKAKGQKMSTHTSTSRASASISVGRPSEDDSTHDANLQKRRRIGGAAQRQVNKNRFADDEAEVSDDEGSTDDTDASETGERNSLEGFIDDSQSQPLDIARPSQETGSDTDTDRSRKSMGNMLDVYRRSLYDAGPMGFASPARQHPHRNRFRTNGPMHHHNSSQQSETETETEGAGEESDGGWVDRQSIDNVTASVSRASHRLLGTSMQRERSSNSGTSLWTKGEEFAMPPPSTNGHAQPQGDIRRESTDGYAAELDNDDMLVPESNDADFDCGIDSLWD